MSMTTRPGAGVGQITKLMNDNSPHPVSRRQAVGWVGLGVAAAAPAVASATTQPWPGLAREMNPKPDHGETSYRDAKWHVTARRRRARSSARCTNENAARFGVVAQAER
jgi:hypothetical protein